MKVTQINYGVTINCGNYESIRFDATAQINDGEHTTNVIDELKLFVQTEANKLVKERKSK